MINNGLIDEVKALTSYQGVQALDTVGYKEIFPFLSGEYDLSEAIRLIKRNSRRYAKRQMTWLRRYENINWINYSDTNKIISFARKIIS
jgi:tRNA dimethylallyltransferase